MFYFICLCQYNGIQINRFLCWMLLDLYGQSAQIRRSSRLGSWILMTQLDARPVGFCGVIIVFQNQEADRQNSREQKIVDFESTGIFYSVFKTRRNSFKIVLIPRTFFVIWKSKRRSERWVFCMFTMQLHHSYCYSSRHRWHDACIWCYT